MCRQTHAQKLFALLALVTFLFLPCLGLRAQRTGRIIGQVRLPGGVLPPERVLVMLQMRGATLNSTFSDNEGRFGFPNLAPHAYRIVVNEEGYYPVSQLVRVDPDIMATTLVRIILRRREKQRPEPPPGLASGGNPHMVSLADYGKEFPPKAVKEFEAGAKADQQGKTDKAIRHYQKAIRLAPDFYPAHNNLGSKYLSQGGFEAAEREFREVIKLNETDANGYFNLGNVLFLTKRHEEARQILQEGLKREPGSALGQFLLGCVYVRTGKFSDAERYLRSARTLDPRMTTVRLELVNLYLRQQRNADAINELKSFVKLFPDNPFLPKAKELLEKLEQPNQSSP